ncbi:hypothetical protein BUALT_Bualt02G0169600 [Buddleja alternifolia]|uniref:Uncharacterized protein n=1 Tax=Buddleja alternifolia TaxID=168488 RepID=A0AAV6Y0W4_9LAMI|nr:hypothetical protein BUALT_Bualt02G0169600 [Buddleja alternifolia]
MQVDATPVEGAISEVEATSKQPQVAAPPPEPVKTVDVEDDEDGLEDLTATPYEEKVENSDVDEEEEIKDDVEYSPFVDRSEDAPFRSAGEPAGGFGDHFNEDDFAEDEDELV